MKSLYYIHLFFALFLLSCSSENKPITEEEHNTESTYFPSINSDVWETKSISDLNWNANELQPLLDYLEEKNSKSFIILHDGKLVVEHYMNDHNSIKSWYWASAGKTLTTATAGIAQDQSFLDINAKVSDYLGTGWTSATIEKENLISTKNLLSMSSGLDDSLGDEVTPKNLQYIADANSRWAYHNVYVKTQDVVAAATGQNWDTYFSENLKDKIGMSGQWISLNNLSVYWSNTRSMARFGLLMYANGTWDETQIISEAFLNEATNTSQNINEAYGYLWWLNGKSSYHLPQSQLEFNGTLIPNAPDDMYAALGKNDQKIYIVPSKKLVIIRMGNAADSENFALSSFDNDLWAKINALIE
ncbi:CubicO group peptidase, beta-lactamase class C family [Algibacter lectus]|uniref:serine hydrolase domain-containing protein n=1 Tax=Algibacter lectus TaxID=221126 RepID=UPI0008E0348C|nr:serine hydrolase [Algibacter lectus]SFD65597.1 CubicO group peptidase, beta-lactamase class C family [Algibacter lectus]